jgi:RNA polymerase sigma factor (sigma-70 family)
MVEAMRPRKDLIELFSTFLQFDHDRVRNWLADSRLKRSMQSQLNLPESISTPQADVSENFWALYWHKQWQTQPTSLARGHLSAYAQEPCYWAAQKTTLGFVSTQYTLADCFQMAIAGFDKLLKGFNSSQGFNFKNYASATFSSLIRETLRQRQEVDICTDWALLRKLSQKRLVEALQNLGATPTAIANMVWAWSCFKTVYVPTQTSGTRKLPKPTPEAWEAIASLYNRDRHIQIATSTPSASIEQLEKWLTHCAKAARQYLYPTAISINTGNDYRRRYPVSPDSTDATQCCFDRSSGQPFTRFKDHSGVVLSPKPDPTTDGSPTGYQAIHRLTSSD